MAAPNRPRMFGCSVSSAALCALVGLCACTHDFSSFRFVEAEPSQPHDAATTSTSAAPTSDAPTSDAPTSDAPTSDASTHDASATSTSRAGSDAALEPAKPPAAHDGAVAVDQTPDSSSGDAHVSQALDTGAVTPNPAPPVVDAGSMPPPSSADDDAQVPTPGSECSNAWNAFEPAAVSCGACACAQCETPVLNCLNRGTAQERAACAGALACALAHKCHDWDCYCATMRCYTMPSLPGDGPCSEEFAAAAGGHDHVSEVHRLNDPNQPLVKAVRAIGCSWGTPFGSVGGMMTGKCVSECTH